MLLFDGAGGLIVLALWIFCFIDVVITPEPLCRNLPKLAWIFLVLLLPLLGSIAWLVAGRTWDRSGQGVASTRSSSRWSDQVGDPRRGTAGARRVPTNPDDDEEFLAGLRRRAEEQRRRAREQEKRDGDKS